MRQYLNRIIVNEGPKNILDYIVYIFLYILSMAYMAGITIRRLLYHGGIFKSFSLDKPVVSVGNITWGGTGKTPLVKAICSHLLAKNQKVVLLTRGYGKDEDLLLSEELPGLNVLSGKDRLKNAMIAERASHVDIFVLDDGFQHLRIKRDIDIVTINAANPFGKGQLIPAGILREPVSGLRRANIVVLAKSDLVTQDEIHTLNKGIQAIKDDIEIFKAVHQPVCLQRHDKSQVPLEYIKRKKIAALCGLGDNGSFLKTLQGLGAEIRIGLLYMDHHPYSLSDITNGLRRCREAGIGTIVTTQKDWVKVRKLFTKQHDVEFLVLKIENRVSDEEGFFRRISALLPR